MKTKARKNYIEAVAALQKFCADQTELEAFTRAESYPFTVQFTPDGTQGRLFDDEPAAPNGLLVEVGLPTKVTVPEGFSLDAALLKKLIRMAEQVGLAYYHAFREEADGETEERA